MKGPAPILLVIFVSAFVLKECNGIFKVDFKLLKLPKFGSPLNFEIFFPSGGIGSDENASNTNAQNSNNNNGQGRSALVTIGSKPSIVFRNSNNDHSGENFKEEPSSTSLERESLNLAVESRPRQQVVSAPTSVAVPNRPKQNQSPYLENPNQNLEYHDSDEYETQMKSLDSELKYKMNKTRQWTMDNAHGSSPAPRPSSAPAVTDDPSMRPANFQNSSLFPDLSILKQLFQWSGQSAKSFALCNACKVGIGLFMLRARSGSSQENMMQTVIFGCTFFKIAPEEMCQGLVARFGPVLLYIVNERSDLSADMFCGMILQSVGCTTKDPQKDWDVLTNYYYSVPRDTQLEKRSSRQLVSVKPPVIPAGVPTIKILHLTDIHVDPHYRQGSNANCEKEMCCGVSDYVPADPRDGAGYYGDYRKCDLPYHSFENALEHISKTHPDIKLIYMTGDLVPHNVWSTDPDENMQIISNSSNLIHKYFPNAIVMPVLGNHDTHPVNLFSPYGVPPAFSTDWVYATTAKLWSQWLPISSLQTFLYGGYYDRVITPKFRVIVLNTNLCYTYNFWLMYEDRDPSGQLRWLAQELEKSEAIGQTVHILGHVPPGQEDCWQVWSQNFYSIISRFSSTVKAQFYGHTHYDEFKVFYHPVEKGRPISSLFIGASLTPYTNLNPGYKIFSVDGARGDESTWHVLDHETWIYNLTKANLNPYREPEWFLLYRATEAYGIPNALPSSLSKFVHRMSSNVTDFNRYYWYYHKAANMEGKGPCDSLCRKRILCNIVTPYQKMQTECMLLQSSVDGVILPMRIFENKRPGSDVKLTSSLLTEDPSVTNSTTPSPSSSSVDGSSDISNDDPPPVPGPSPSLFDRIFGSASKS